jgi:hypothetical protein
VRSTTQRRGRTTKPFMSSFRLTISVRSGGTFATAASTCHALKPPSAQISSTPREAPAYLVEDEPGLVEDEAGPVAVLDRGRGRLQFAELTSELLALHVDARKRFADPLL